MPARLTNSTTQYGAVARLLHWTSVVLLLTPIVTSSALERLDDGPEKLALIRQHASWGLLLLLVMVMRLTWRIRNPNPVRSYTIREWQKTAAVFLHWTIYLVIITQSVIGIANVLTGGTGVPFFSLFETPPLLRADAALHERLVDAHVFLSIVIYPMFAVHVSAALYHRVFGVRDEPRE